MSFTDTTVMNLIQYIMIEAPDAGQTWGSGLWTKEEVVRYLNQRQNRFLKDTHLQIGIMVEDGLQGIADYDLPCDWIATARVVWIYPDGSTKELQRSDTWEADYGIPDWSYVEGPPLLYMDADQPSLTLKIAPLPDTDGTIQIHYVPLAAALDGDGELFTLPDEFVTPVIKYGVLADMFSKVGRANDPARAEYCSKRYGLGLEIARMLIAGFQDASR